MSAGLLLILILLIVLVGLPILFAGMMWIHDLADAMAHDDPESEDEAQAAADAPPPPAPPPDSAA